MPEAIAELLVFPLVVPAGAGCKAIKKQSEREPRSREGVPHGVRKTTAIPKQPRAPIRQDRRGVAAAMKEEFLE
jgi:hypothetical protein